ncbi:MAG TPA: Sua5/YciO/YrdC/YwlC family protein, partial [Coriobacteriia bacterium]
MSKVIHIDPEAPSAEAINLAASVLRDGGIVIFPTETVYGIGAAATSCIGPQEIIDIKMRPAS